MTQILIINEAGNPAPVVARCSHCGRFIGFYDTALNIVARLTYQRERKRVLCCNCGESAKRNPLTAIANTNQDNGGLSGAASQAASPRVAAPAG